MLFRVLISLFFIISTPSLADEKLENELEKLILNKERIKAIKILHEELEKEGLSDEKRANVEGQLRRIETIFFTDDAQKDYQIGLSQFFNDTSLAKSHLEKAFSSEPNNFELVIANILVNLRLRNCSEAKKIFDSFQPSWPASGKRQLIELQLKACRGDYNLFSENEKEGLSSTDRSQFNLHFTILRVKSAIANKNYDIALELIKNGKSLDTDFPETTYWEWYILKALNKEDIALYKNYLYQCKKLSLKKKILYRWSYDLCLQSNQRASI